MFFYPSGEQLARALVDYWGAVAEGVSGVFVLVDENTGRYCLPDLVKGTGHPDIHFIEVKSGERNKNLESCTSIWDRLLHAEADRKSLLINLGGGVISDMGGFVASVFKRGIRFINIPTTLLGMVDAAIGGKTGVDFMSYKNQVGLFSFPEMVMVFPGFLSTLPQRHILNGLAEVVKYALIADEHLWHVMLESDPFEIALKPDTIHRCIQIKSGIVENDPFERGERKMLNFGHTIGHALESLALQKDDDVLHGEAVAAGIVCESYLSYKKLGLQKSHLERIAEYIYKTFPPVIFTEDDIDQIVYKMYADKKNENGNLLFSLTDKPGQCVLNCRIDGSEAREALMFYIDMRNEGK